MNNYDHTLIDVDNIIVNKFLYICLVIFFYVVVIVIVVCVCVIIINYWYTIIIIYYYCLIVFCSGENGYNNYIGTIYIYTYIYVRLRVKNRSLVDWLELETFNRL